MYTLNSALSVVKYTTLISRLSVLKEWIKQCYFVSQMFPLLCVVAPLGFLKRLCLQKSDCAALVQLISFYWIDLHICCMLHQQHLLEQKEIRVCFALTFWF